MCEPTTLLVAQLALTAATTAASLDAQRSSANKQADAAKQAGAMQQMDLARQGDQQAEASAGEMNAHARQASHDAALFGTIAGEYGGGNTSDRNRAVAGLQTGEQLATIQDNATTAQVENRFASLGSKQRTDAQLASIQQPSYLGAALQIGAGALGAYGQYKTQQAREEDANLPRTKVIK